MGSTRIAKLVEYVISLRDYLQRIDGYHVLKLILMGSTRIAQLVEYVISLRDYLKKNRWISCLETNSNGKHKNCKACRICDIPKRLP